MTEDEALTKWCPLTYRVSRKKTITYPKCIASYCMLWRLISPLDPNDGYCGLADPPRILHSIPSDSDE